MNRNTPEHVAALIERIGRLLHTDAHAGRLLPVHWEALRYLDRANRFSRTPAALTAYLGATKGTVSQTLNTLQARGLIEKAVDARDRRSRRLSLSARGRSLLRRDPLIETASAIEGLNEQQRAGLSDGLAAILSRRLASRDRQPFGQCVDCRYFARKHPDGKPHYCQLLNEPLTRTDSDAICYEQQPAA